MDCATTAASLLAANVKLVYCRPIAFASANIDETLLAVKMGIPVLAEFFPKEIRGENGKVTGIVFTGADNVSTLTLATDKVIFAVGQEKADDLASLPEHPRLFAGGDRVNGGSTVVAAIASATGGQSHSGHAFRIKTMPALPFQTNRSKDLSWH